MSFYLPTFNLKDLKVLVTRPLKPGQELCELINRYEGHGIFLPTIQFAEQAFDSQVFSKLKTYDWIIFVSQNAVQFSEKQLQILLPLNNQTKIAVVGESTANALRGLGINAIYPKEWSTEGLLKLPQFSNVRNQKIAIIKGLGGRKTLEEVLLERGAEVSPIIVYHRSLPNIDMLPFFSLVRHKQINVLLGSSYEGVKNLKTLFGDAYFLDIKNIPLVVVSERIKALAHELSFKTIWVSDNASHEAILKLLAEKREEICQIQAMK